MPKSDVTLAGSIVEHTYKDYSPVAVDTHTIQPCTEPQL